MNYHLTLKSSNKKTGPIPVSITSSESCPPACPFLGSGCYAEVGPLMFHWRKVNNGVSGGSLATFLQMIEALPENQLWRHNQAGDLPGKGNEIDEEEFLQLVKSNLGKRGFTYTHKPMTEKNQRLVKFANQSGFTINLSADNLDEADELADLNVGPVAVVLPSDVTESFRTPKGRKVVVCPAAIRDDFTCLDCELCALSQRKSIIGFPAHGTGKRKVNDIVKITERV